MAKFIRGYSLMSVPERVAAVDRLRREHNDALLEAPPPLPKDMTQDEIVAVAKALTPPESDQPDFKDGEAQKRMTELRYVLDTPRSIAQAVREQAARAAHEAASQALETLAREGVLSTPPSGFIRFRKPPRFDLGQGHGVPIIGTVKLDNQWGVHQSRYGGYEIMHAGTKDWFKVSDKTLADAIAAFLQGDDTTAKRLRDEYRDKPRKVAP